ncbi:MAG: hypothetical protein JJU36_02300 [Phycisphaeraceae bacterium]|nr:hypothetical protein [Phycisphaeraceae bacterium]
MPLIKSPNQSVSMRDTIVLDFGDLARQADRVREDARASAVAIIQHARAEAMALARGTAEEARRKGYQEGLAQGLEEGRASGHQEALQTHQAEFKALIEGWRNGMNELTSTRQAMLNEGAEKILQFALLVASRLVLRTIEVDVRVAVDQVRRALDIILGDKAVIVRVHPEDEPTINEAMPTLLQAMGANAALEVVPDAEVGRGGCIVQAGQGTIDGRIESQLARLIDTLRPLTGQSDNPMASKLETCRNGQAAAAGTCDFHDSERDRTPTDPENADD